MLIEDLTYILTNISTLDVDYDDSDCQLLFKHKYYDVRSDTDKIFIYTTSDDINMSNSHEVYLVHHGLGHAMLVGVYEFGEFRPAFRIVVRFYSNNESIVGDEVKELNYVSDDGLQSKTPFGTLFNYDNSGAPFWNNNLIRYRNLEKLKNKL